MENLKKTILNYINNNEIIYSVIASNPRDREKISKLKLRPVLKSDIKALQDSDITTMSDVYYQAESFVGTKAFHKNISVSELPDFLVKAATDDFKQLEIETSKHKTVVLISKKGKITIKEKLNTNTEDSDKKSRKLSHNKTKQYILPQDEPVPFLVELGVQTSEGKIINAKYDKFRQINRYLEFVRDVLPALPKDRVVNIIDFGCGKSYLTFALYYYLKVMNNFDIRVIGLDLKEDVIQKCQALADKFGYDGLKFLVGDISTYNEADTVDMVVTLHACDTATDYALAKAVKWGASVILSVPCCQHELNKQIKCEVLEPALKYGLIKERISALMTDAIRANLLEAQGYDTQILEFIDMEHTPKNILIRAVKRRHIRYTGNKNLKSSVDQMEQFLKVEPTLNKLLAETD